MSSTRTWVGMAAAAGLAALVACGGGGGSPGPAAPLLRIASGVTACAGDCDADAPGGAGVGGSASAALARAGLPMRQVRFTARRPDGTVLASAVAPEGVVSLQADGAAPGPFVLELADDGSGTGKVYDPAAGGWQPIGSRRWRVMVPALAHHLGVNALTEAAYRIALLRHGSEAGLTGPRMAAANAAVRDALNLRLPAPYHVRELTQTAAPAGAEGLLPSTHAGRYGLVLAAKAHAAREFDASLPAPLLAAADHALADLLDDERLNGSADGAPPAYDRRLPFRWRAGLVEAITRHGAAGLPAPGPVANLCHNPALDLDDMRWELHWTDPTDYLNPETIEEYRTRASVPVPWDPSVLALAVERESKVGSFGEYFYFWRTPFIQINGASERVVRGESWEFADYLWLSGDTGGFAGDGEDRFQPAAVDRRHLLDVGESFDVVYQAHSFSSVRGSTEIIDVAQTTTFVGFEDVAVPAGTFRGACRFDTTDAGVTTSFWLTSSGDGVAVRIGDRILASGSFQPPGVTEPVPVR